MNLKREIDKAKKKLKRNYNWWILVLPSQNSLQAAGSIFLITNRFLPTGDITDSKASVYQDFPIPGLDYTPFKHVRNEGAKISFTVPIIKNDKDFGNSHDLAMIEMTRHVTQDLASLSEKYWSQNPMCIYSGWGTHRPPLPVVVESAEYAHKQYFTNKRGFVKYTEVAFTMRYLENSSLYKMWKKYQQTVALVNNARQFNTKGFGGY